MTDEFKCECGADFKNQQALVGHQVQCDVYKSSKKKITVELTGSQHKALQIFEQAIANGFHALDGATDFADIDCLTVAKRSRKIYKQSLSKILPPNHELPATWDCILKHSSVIKINAQEQLQREDDPKEQDDLIWISNVMAQTQELALSKAVPIDEGTENVK